MRMICILKSKTQLLSIVGFLGMVFLTLSCEHEAIDDESLVPNVDVAFDVSKVAAISKDLVVIDEYFNADNIAELKYDTKVVFGKDTVVASILNNLGVGKDTATGYTQYSIFNNEPLNSIVKSSVNELFMKQIVVSWDVQKSNHIVDSILSQTLGKDSQLYNVSLEAPSALKNCIFIDVLLVNKFGNIEIDYEQNMNDFLLFKSSNYEGFVADEITLSPQLFRSGYGDKYASSLIMGTSCCCKFVVSDVDCKAGKETEILVEAMDLIEKAITEKAKWNDLKMESTYLKNSIHYTPHVTGIPTINLLFGIDGLVDYCTTPDSLYKQSHFGILARGYEPYSKLYPNYEFVK